MKWLIFHVGRLRFKFPFDVRDLTLKIHFTDLKLIFDAFNIPWSFAEDKKEECKK
jgi:hypothetical protein